MPTRLRAAVGAGKVVELFSRWGAWAVFVSRFALTPVALPINLMAGSTRLSWGLYTTAVLTGEVIWVALFGGLGYLFAAQWEAISQLAADMAGVLLGIAFVATGVAAIVVRRRRRQPAPSG